MISSGVGDPGGTGVDVDVGHAQEGIVAPRGGEGAPARFLLADVVRRLAVGLQPHQDALADERPRLRLDAVIVVAHGAHAAGDGAIGGDVEQLRSVLERAEIAQLDETGARVIGFVADDAIEFGGVRDDLVDGEHRVRRRHDQVLEPDPHRRRRAVLRRLGGDARDVLQHPAVERNLVAARARGHGERPLLHLVVLACRHVEAGEGAPQFLLDERALGGGQVLPFEIERESATARGTRRVA